jgi:hypothetical protein
MPWKKTEPMEQRIEFALKALRTFNFRALCQEYGISAKTGYKWKAQALCERSGAFVQRAASERSERSVDGRFQRVAEKRGKAL